MKKVFIILAIILVLLLAALFIIPSFFKGDIIKIIQNQTEKHIHAEVSIGDIELSMFKSFPNLNVAVKQVSISGKEEFSQDTIVRIPLFEASVNLKSLMSGNEIIINKVLLKDSRFAPRVTASGKANWDILISTDTTTAPSAQPEATAEQAKEDKGLLFNDIAIEHLQISYADLQNQTYAQVEDINMQLSGNFSAKNTLLKLALALQNISFRQQDNIWVNQMDFAWNTDIGADFEEQVYELQNSNLSVNELRLNLDGKVAMLEDRFRLDLTMNAPDTKFESLLALIPKNFKHYLDGLNATGDFNLNIKAQGDVYENHLPAIDAQLKVNQAEVQYSGLPEAIRKINIDLNVTNPGGSADSTTLDLKCISFDIGGNPFSMFLKVSHLDDPLLKGGANGTINFSNLKKALPLKDITLEGVVTTDITLEGKYQYIEKEQYEKFLAKGNISLKDVLYKDADFPKGISVPQGSVTITPAKLNLNNLLVKINSSDFSLKGNISNYLPYLLKNETLKGNFSLSSKLIDLNEFMSAPAKSTDSIPSANTNTSSANPAEPNTTTPGSTLEIPRNLNLQLNTDIQTILFDNLTIKDVSGNVSLADAVATLKNLKMNLLNGSMVMNGKYNATKPQTPTVDFDLNVKNFDIKSAFNSFSFIRQSLPIAMNCQGVISSDMKFAASLNQNMELVMNSVNGNGFLESKELLINDNPAMTQLAGVLKNDELSRLSISYLKINFKLENGNIVIEPFKTTMAGNPVTIYGQQSVEGRLNYTFSANINRKYFGKEINNLLQALPGSNNIQSLDVDLKLEGTLNNPVVKPDLTKAVNALKKEAEKELKNKAKGEIIKGLEKLFK